MKQVFLYGAGAVTALVLLFALTGCRELTTVDRPYQRVLIDDFSAPLRTLLPALDHYPKALRLKVSGSINRPVTLAVDQVISGQGRQLVRRDTLAAGTYADKYFISSNGLNSKEQIELTVTGAPGTTGSLAIEWSAW